MSDSLYIPADLTEMFSEFEDLEVESFWLTL